LASTITNALDTLLDGRGHDVTLGGNNAVRLFNVGTNTSLAIINLTLANGFSSCGSAIVNYGGKVSLTGATLRTNVATTTAVFDGSTPFGAGGAICNLGGTIGATNCTFIGNEAYAGPGFPSSGGGAIRNQSGELNLEHCSFVANRASGGPSPQPQVAGTGASGGAIHNNAGNLTVSACTFAENSVFAGDGYSNYGTAGGTASGGAIFNSGTARVVRSTFFGNSARGGTGGSGYNGGTYMDLGLPGGPGAVGGSGDAGALFNSGTASLINCTITANQGTAGAGGNGGRGGGPYVKYGGNGGNGGAGGAGVGGVHGTCNVTNCTLAFNVGIGGVGGAGGSAGGGMISPGSAGTSGSSGSAWGATECNSPPNTFIASNTPPGNESFPDPRLGPLTDNGGPTLTMALLPGSPAIDAADTSIAPLTDQRGFPRPAGSGADLGAFEYGSMLPVLSIARLTPANLEIVVRGNSNQWCRIFVSSNFSMWFPVATNQFNSAGITQFQDDNSQPSVRFYRVTMP
jgi:hypothetical protein